MHTIVILIKKHFNTLTYPDGTEILTLPDDPNRIFQLDEYQKDVGKAYNHITLYLLKRSDQELYNQLQQASGSDSDPDPAPPEENHATSRQMTVLESFACAGPSTASTQTSSPSANSSGETSAVTTLDSSIANDLGNGQSKIWALLLSIKNLEREKHGKDGSFLVKIYGEQQRVPRQWKKFLSNGKNKEEFMKFLFEAWKTADPQLLNGIEVFITHKKECHKLTASNNAMICSNVEELGCDHEEADTRMVGKT